jgi:hypothetical protein
MNRCLAAGVCVVAAVAGCQTTPKLVEPFPEPSRASGAWVVLDDQRPDWEKEPVAGPVVSLYRFSRVSPNPWVRLQKATEAVVAELPEKPERVDVVVASFRLASKEAEPPPRREEGGTVRLNGRNTADIGKDRRGADGWNYQHALAASKAGDGQTAGQAVGLLASQGGAPSVGVDVGDGPAIERPDGPLDGLAPGAHCNLRGVVRLSYPGGRTQDVAFTVLAGRPNQTGSRYWGETLEVATQLAMMQYTRQIRQGVGLPPGE